MPANRNRLSRAMLRSGFSFLLAAVLITLGLVTSAGCGPTLEPDTTSPSAEELESSRQALAAGTMLGMYYTVPGFIGTWNTTQFTHSTVQKAFKRDAAIMAAHGVRVVKLAVVPSFAGMHFNENAGATIDDPSNSGSDLAQAIQSLRGIIQEYDRYGMQVIIVFMTNDLYLRGPDGIYAGRYPDGTPLSMTAHKRNWYNWSYWALGANGPGRAASDFRTWETRLLSNLRASSPALIDRALYYVNLATEVIYSMDDWSYPGNVVTWPDVSHALVRALLNANTGFARDRIAADVLFPENDLSAFASDIPAGGIGFSEVHSYPLRNVNADVANKLRMTRNGLVSTGKVHTVHLGEFAVDFCATNEGGERSTFMSGLDAATSEGAMLVQWELWDSEGSGTDCTDSSRLGLGYGVNNPRNVLGGLAERMSSLPGGNFEGGTKGWYADGTITSDVSLSALTGSAATGNGFIRMQSTGTGTYWVCSPAFSLPKTQPSSTGPRLAVSAYLRSLTSTLSLNVHYRDGLGWTDATGRVAVSQSFSMPGAARYVNLQARTGGTYVQLPPEAREARLCFVMSGTGYLDIDTVSVKASRKDQRNCPCAGSGGNTCYFPPNTPGCPITYVGRPGCYPDGISHTSNTDWTNGWYENEDTCWY